MEQENQQKPLLEKVYYEDCPGCKVERKKDANSGIPYKEFSFVFLATISTSLPIASVFPFLYFMIRDLHIAKRVENIGFYAGFVGSSFMLGRALTSVPWGIASDQYGRKPVILIGIASVIIFNTLFGLSTQYWMAIVTRFLLGTFNGLLGTIKAYAIEVARPEHQALGIVNVSTGVGVGLIVGPAIGGLLAQPADKYPSLFSKESLFGRFPYFLPCLAISILAAIVLISCCWLPETLHRHIDKAKDGTVEALEASQNDTELLAKDTSANESLLKNWPLMSSIVVYCVFSLQDMAYTEIFPLWAESDRKYGGLSYSTEDVGEVLAISGFSLLPYQVFLYPYLVEVIGIITTSRAAALLTIPLLNAYPFMTKLSRLKLLIAVNFASLIRICLNETIITGTLLLQNNAVSQEQRGVANGIAMTLMSLSKTIGPASAGSIFSWAQTCQHTSFLPGDHMVFFVLSMVAFIGFLLTFKPFLTLPRK